ncbi:hypothetical protein ACFY2H_00605 [Streptomyces griseofuscus]|uniref:hypothetical protein n=1 Tax=Streptomyces griseofuscus TaxID=146922 RepID=UPI00367C4EA3
MTNLSYELRGELLEEVLSLHRERMDETYDDFNDLVDGCLELVSELAESIEREMAGAS